MRVSLTNLVCKGSLAYKMLENPCASGQASIYIKDSGVAGGTVLVVTTSLSSRTALKQLNYKRLL